MSMACREDLLCRRRSGCLNEAEEASLRAHLAACPTCALEAGVHDAFEAVGRPRPDDRVLITSAVDRALRPGALRSSRNRGTRPGLSIAVGTAVVVVAGLASAGLWSYRASLQKRAVATPPARTTEVAPALPRTEPAIAATVPPASAADAVFPSAQTQASAGPGEAGPGARPLPRERSSRARSKVASVQASAAPAAAPVPVLDLKTLFASASEARKAGDHGRAAELYAEIERRFPDSREARLSFVAFGRMLLDRGEHARALAQFEHYLSVAASDVLAAEACYGRARALVGLGRASDARRAWAELLSQFPGSIYADVARRQMGQPQAAR